MEARYGFGQLPGRILRQQALEMAKCLAALIKVFRFLHQVIAGCASDKQVHPPVISPAVHIVRGSLPGPDKIQSLPVRISVIFNDLLPQEGGDPLNIPHKRYRILKDIRIHPLKNIRMFLTYETEGIIDVAAAVALAADCFPIRGKRCGRLL